MTITLDTATEQLLQRELDRGVFATPEEAIAVAVRLLSEPTGEDWLLRNRDFIRTALEESTAQAARGEGYSPEESRALLAQHREARKNQAA